MLRWLFSGFALIATSCSAGRDVGALHRPDLSLTKLAIEATGPSHLFRSYNPNGNVLWSQEWTWDLDLSGIAWDRSNTATVITPRHVVMASHYIRKQGDAVVFHDRTGRRHERIIEKVVHFRDRGVQGDIAVGLLDRALPESIRSYPLPEPRADDGAALVGAIALVTEQNRELYFHQIDRVLDHALLFRFDPRISENRRKSLVGGDSGHPSFLLSKGELVLIETHTGGGPGSGPFYGARQVIETIQAIIRDTDSGYSVRTVAMDEKALAEAAEGRTTMPAPPPAPPAQPAPQPAPASADPSTQRTPRPRVVRPPN